MLMIKKEPRKTKIPIGCFVGVKQFSIKDMEVLSGVKAHTIRMWEQRFQMFEPRRTPGNIRYYNETDLRKLLNLSYLSQQGYKVSVLARMSEEELSSRVLDLSLTCTGNEIRIQSLTMHMLQLNEPGFTQLLSVFIRDSGLERVMLDIVFPFFRAIGFMWQTGTITPAHEHFITHLIRQKLIVSIDQIDFAEHENSRKYLLFLPEDEFHELGLLFAHYVIRSRGHHTVYLGANVPYCDLKTIYLTYKPQALLCILTSAQVDITAADYLMQLCTDFPQTEILASGKSALNASSENSLHGVTLMSDFSDLIDCFETVC
ncbi:MAG: MerR family transcriptional regulator [Sphingomonadales bacterium]|nr:MerR family transcriptional regulator [Sphingomonadales bacterium]